MCIGLVVTPEGLPVAYEVFKGNRADVTTVPQIVRTMEDKYGQAERIWVLDRGMVSKANLAFPRARKAAYIVGTSKAQLRQFESALLDRAEWHEVQGEVQVKLVPHPDGAGREQFVLCRSTARAAKERAMLARQQERLLGQLVELDASLRVEPRRDLGPVNRRLGRWAHQAHGAYLLRTNCVERDPAQLWRWYIQLTQAEAAFRTEKSDLHLRPIYHQKTERVEAHLLVCFLALAMWRTLEMWMKGKGLGSCARQLLAEIATVKSLDIVLPVRTAEGPTELRLRTVARPEPRVAQLLHHLGVALPTGTREIQNVVAKTGV